ncbi:D-alanyl-D-alanine carboxypeptidase family protein [Minwuia sp.]|uniref:D-alanyl-D-alanine carboxypeptidase family protein n=1 Tax=Minwuia sp. TaxID=2493630 RepID=UPI003A8D58CD
MPRFVYLLIFLTFGLSAGAARAADFETNATHAIIIEAESGRVLYGKQIDDPIPTASMSKMVTVYMLMEELAKGTLTEDDTFTVSEKAWRKGGSKMFVELGKQIRVGDLLRGIVVQSGNDASIVVAEGLAGTEEAFAEKMNERARELGLTDTLLKNATGWPDPEHRMSVHDLARIARLTILNFPQYYPIYAEKSFTYHDIKQGNRNPVLYKFAGADGLKTGHTEEAGYGLTASAERDGHRLIAVIAGLESSRVRATESVRLLQWAFRTFRNHRLLSEGEVLDKAEVWLGESTHVPLVAGEDVNFTMDAESRKGMTAHLVYEGPVPAPIRKGEKIAELVIRVPDADPLRVPMLAGADVGKLGITGRIAAALGYLIFGGS